MNVETIFTLIGVLGGVETLKWLLTFRSAARKARAEASESVVNTDSLRNKMYEETILFLQSQLQEKEKNFALLNDQLHNAMRSELDLTRRLGEMQLKFLSSRCDRRECALREPPFEWIAPSPLPPTQSP